jgi:hypothetical protein
MRVIRVSLLAALALLTWALAFTTTPAHAAKAINGTCGVHIGRLVKGFDHEWHCASVFAAAGSAGRCTATASSVSRPRRARSVGRSYGGGMVAA